MQTHERHGHAGWQPQDAEIEHGIKNALARHPAVKIMDLKIMVKDRDVTLKGKVANQRDFEHAGVIAANVLGIRDFKNELAVPPSGPITPTQL
ncbi:MAG: BON domain-containing protein [bacterium]